jgi:hypothetical protein
VFLGTGWPGPVLLGPVLLGPVLLGPVWLGPVLLGTASCAFCGLRGGSPSFSMISAWTTSIVGRASTVMTYSFCRNTSSMGLVSLW